MGIAPSKASAKVGDRVQWVNNDVFDHTAIARNGDWDVTIPARKSVSTVLSKAGTIKYYCRFHPNMVATMTIAR
jgi:plastocyanin